jgi:IclR family KDG regulon transcriptional repressor
VSVMEQEEKGLTLTVMKAMDVLDCLGEAQCSMSATEIGRELGMSRSTVYRLLATLTTGGYVTRDGVRAEKYRLGFKVLELASRLLDGVELRQQARPFLCELRDLANEAVHLVVMADGQVSYIEKVECSQSVRMHSTIGRRGFAHCTALGKAMLAFMPADRVEGILEEHGLPARTPNTITDRRALWREMERIREQGYAIDDIENEEGIRCVGAPILDYQGQPVAALSISGPAFRMTLERIQELSASVKATALKISRQLGYLEGEDLG